MLEGMRYILEKKKQKVLSVISPAKQRPWKIISHSKFTIKH